MWAPSAQPAAYLCQGYSAGRCLGAQGHQAAAPSSPQQRPFCQVWIYTGEEQQHNQEAHVLHSPKKLSWVWQGSFLLPPPMCTDPHMVTSLVTMISPAPRRWRRKNRSIFGIVWPWVELLTSTDSVPLSVEWGCEAVLYRPAV